MSAKKLIRCAIYTRKSTEEGLEQDFNSLDAQREACQAYITSQKAEGWIALKDRFDDGGYSGGTLERPALKRILAGIEDGAIDVVVVYKIDRLSRSLMDFAKLVEVFDRRSVTFVSVTQSFNTTTSMGRLTLNVLLSFAQFEREVTGERIRDKIAASKKKGIWMGGNPPLGYDVRDRKLVVNGAEAESVRHIYRRYLDLGCVRLLSADLDKSGFVSKRRVFADGRKAGGLLLGRATLYALLANRTYLGETHHKGQHYRGEHEAIVSRDLFEAVQKQLAENAPNITTSVRAPQDALCAGLLFDQTGASMVATYTKKGGARYRYYVSLPAKRGDRSTAAIHRIPAPPFEAFLSTVLDRLALAPADRNDGISTVVRRIEILADSIVIKIDRAEALARWGASIPEETGLSDREILDRQRQHLTSGENLVKDGKELRLLLPVRARFRGGRAAMLQPTGSMTCEPRPDAALIKALARACKWKLMLLNDEVRTVEDLARRVGQQRRQVGRILGLAFIKPELTAAILRGEQPPGLRLAHLLEADIPLSWHAQTNWLEQLWDPSLPRRRCA